MTKQRRPKNIAADAKRTLARIERLSVKAVSVVMGKVDREGELSAYEGIEAAREIREMITRVFADFSRSRAFHSVAVSRKRPRRARSPNQSSHPQEKA